MAQNVAGPEIERLIQLLARLPGLGPRSARRAALHLIKKRDTLLNPLSEAMRVANERIVVCSSCGNVDTSDPCTICRDPRRDTSILVVVEDVSDLWALERSGWETMISLQASWRRRATVSNGPTTSSWSITSSRIASGDGHSWQRRRRVAARTPTSNTTGITRSWHGLDGTISIPCCAWRGPTNAA